ncbi:hypothetical protein BG006_009437 [Podila minutissima]|uniref:Dolichyl-phosphate-mannose--protein mannosyltransferase n=1 Tax=Podila minutissima TaxID=64525 RepID=A0A9P5SH42_9FUNG|nr:hypothetical protein BG006_009437 [Podila minutissima]
MMWTQLRAVETQEAPAAGVSSKPWQWPLAQAMLLAWVGDQGQQIAITANTFKNYHLRDARVYFAGWAISFAPFLFLTQPRIHVLHHYFPSLYFAILVACSVFSGITAFLSRSARLALHIGFIALVAGMFARLMTITYGTPMYANQCRSLDQWLAKTIKLGQTTSSFLDCSFDSPSNKSASVLAPHVGKAVSVEKRPILKAHYHHPDHELPYQDAYYLMPFQRPPQQWRKFQKAKPDVHQIQMLKGRLGQNFDWITHTEDRMKFQRWIEQDGVDPWVDQRQAEEEMARKKLEEEEEQRVLMENRRIEWRRIKKEKIRAKEEQKRTKEEQKRAKEEQKCVAEEQKRVEEGQKRVEEEQQRAEEEQRHMEKEQRQAAEANIAAAQSQKVPNPNTERIEKEFLEVMEEFRLVLMKDHEELCAAREGPEVSAEDKAVCEWIQNPLRKKMAEAGLEHSFGNEKIQAVNQAPTVEQETSQESQVEEHPAEQISNEQEPVQETKPIEAHQDDTSPSEHAKRTYLDTVIMKAQCLADHNKSQDATLPSDNDLPAQQFNKVL